jgi:hypothetical protein
MNKPAMQIEISVCFSSEIADRIRSSFETGEPMTWNDKQWSVLKMAQNLTPELRLVAELIEIK